MSLTFEMPGVNGSNGNGRGTYGLQMAPATQPQVRTDVPEKNRQRVCNTLVISDLHLGSDVCQAKAILETLKTWKFRRLVILGDAFDDMRFKRLKRSHFKVLSRINKISAPKNRTEVVWVEGNHDDDFLAVVSTMLGIPVRKEYMFQVGGRRYLAIHGHRFDKFMNDNPRLTSAASWLYLLVQRRDTRRQNLSRYLKRKSKGADVVMCGHTHIPVHRKNYGGLEYVNTGCWTDVPCTYATIDHDGIKLHKHTPQT